MNPKTLSPLQQRFCDEYLQDYNGKAAAIRAGYSPKTAKSHASELLRLPQVERYLAEKEAAHSEALHITTLRILQQYADIAFFDIRTLFDENQRLLPPDEQPPAAAAAVAKVEVYRQYDTSGNEGKKEPGVVKVVPHKKIAALRALAKYLRLFDQDYQQTLRHKDEIIYIGGEEEWFKSTRAGKLESLQNGK